MSKTDITDRRTCLDICMHGQTDILTRGTLWGFALWGACLYKVGSDFQNMIHCGVHIREHVICDTVGFLSNLWGFCPCTVGSFCPCTVGTLAAARGQQQTAGLLKLSKLGHGRNLSIIINGVHALWGASPMFLLHPTEAI